MRLRLTEIHPPLTVDTLEEGDFFRKELKPALENKARLRKVDFSSEIDTVLAVCEARVRARQSNWIPGTPTMTDDDHLQVIHQLRNETTRSQITVTSDE